MSATASARRYAHWDTPESLLETWGPREDSDAKVKATHKALVDELGLLTSWGDICIDHHLHPGTRVHRGPRTNHVELLVTDEADRLSPITLEHLRDRFDRQHFGLLPCRRRVDHNHKRRVVDRVQPDR